MSNEKLFRKNVFGGFNRDDVIDYIENMKNDFFEYRAQVELTVKELNEKITKLEGELRTADKKLFEANKKAEEAVENSMMSKKAAKDAEEQLEKEKAALTEKSENSSLCEINLATDRLKKVADEICDNLSTFIEKISENSFAVTIAQPETETSAPADFEKSEEPKKSEEKRLSETDAKSILSFIDGLLASAEAEIKKETEKKNEKSCLDGLLSDNMFN